MPAAGIKALRKIQIGKEVVGEPGSRTSVAADARLIGTVQMGLNQEIHQPNQWDTGLLASFESSIAVAREVSLPFDGDATYDHLHYLFGMAVKGGVFPSGGVYTYEPNYEGTNNPDSYTFEYGDDVQAYKTDNVGCRQLELAGQIGQVLTVKADLFGKDMDEISAGFTLPAGGKKVAAIVIDSAGTYSTNTAPTVTISAPGGGGTQATAVAVLEPVPGHATNHRLAAISITNQGSGYSTVPTVTVSGTGTATAILNSPGLPIPSREIIPAAHANFYVADTYAGLYGATDFVSGAKQEAILVDFSWRFMTGFSPQRFADGKLTYSSIAEAKRHVELDATVAFNSTTKDWYTSLYREQGYKWFGLGFDNGKTGNDERYLHLPVGGKITQFAPIADREGQDIVKIKIVSEYDETSGVARDMLVKNKAA